MFDAFDPPITDAVAQFAALVAIAMVVQLTVERVRLPGLTGLLIAGMLIGPGGLGWLPREPVVEFLGSVGLVYLMFMAGLEVDLEIVKTHRRETITFGVLSFALSLVPAAVIGLVLGYSIQAAILLGVLLSSHTLVAYPVVVRLGLLHRRPVVAAIGGTLITDTLALALLVIALQFGNGGDAADGLPADNGNLGWVLPLVLLAALAAFSLWLVPRLSRCVFDRVGATQAEKALFVLAIVLGLSVIAELIGTKDILGAFLAGLCLNRIMSRRAVLREHVEFAGRMLFIPFFFISTGMLLELEILTGRLQTWLLAAMLVAIVVFGKSSAALLSGAWFGYGLRERILMTGLTLPQAAATLAVTMAAREADLFPERLVDAVIILIFITCLAGPLVARYAGAPLAEAHGGPAEKPEDAPGRR